jgi:hypothetical protein
MNENADWHELVEEFRRLGGTADNICLRNGTFGRGIFPVDPSLPVLVHAPENLLLPVEDASFQDGKFRVAGNSRMGSAERAWLEHYMESYSWGGGGRAEVEAYFAGLAAIPQPLRETVAGFFQIACPEAPSSAAVQKRFLDSRVILYKQRRVVMPIVELINHGHAAAYDRTDGVRVGGTFSGEVLVSYGLRDAFMIYQGWGFPGPQRHAFSLPYNSNTDVAEILVINDVQGCRLLEVPGIKAPVPVPRLTLEGGKIKLSFLLLGWKGFPKIPKAVFRRVFREAGLTMTDDPFDLILHNNRLKYIELLTKLDGVQGSAASALRAVCLYQLEALAYSYGVREI